VVFVGILLKRLSTAGIRRGYHLNQGWNLYDLYQFVLNNVGFVNIILFIIIIITTSELKQNNITYIYIEFTSDITKL
jgi:hypothetical protein